jgi:hypothetical protein
MPRSLPPVHITDPQDAQLAEYRALAGQAVLALIFGLLSPVALIDPLLWAVPLLGLLFSVWALRRIKRYAPAMIGRKAALSALALSLLFAAAAPADWLLYRKLVGDEARQVADLWFRCLLDDQPQKAHQLTMAPQFRQPLGNKPWDFYRGNPRWRQALEDYVQLPLIRTLLALGPRALVRFYQTAGQARDNENDAVDLLYAVTYEESGERKSFFVSVRLLRTKLASGGADWRIQQTDGGVKPEGW